ncbi:hypothetical protein FHL15_010867 [Xylaria flabelliformis]|uniref:Heterokaryon incompatibility domain-containing protein n=1 Tax=Xylaria flabelliformis TaxID=2512241 RepID=A0A553HJW1_9PEZI|nr:hypothetical protein FHL15_010867 [Xylaria flabelliformis]
MDDSNVSTIENPVVAPGPSATLYWLPRADPHLPIRVYSRPSDLSTCTYVYISSCGLSKGAKLRIFVDDEERHVPARIALWLFRILDVEEEAMFWADGLCQPESKFRTLTARQDGVIDIIRYAHEVWCLIGEPRSPELGEKVCDALGSASRHWKDACASVGAKIEQPLYTLTAQQKMGIAEWLRRSGSEDLEKIDESMWGEIVNMFDSAYWNSVECIAELVVGRSVWTLWGRRCISLENYMSAFRALTYFRLDEETVPLRPSTTRAWKMAVAIHAVRYFNKTWHKVDLRHLLQLTRFCPFVRAELRDIIIAMAGLCMPKESRIERFENKYLKSIQDVFVATARYIVYERQDLSIWD